MSERKLREDGGEINMYSHRSAKFWQVRKGLGFMTENCEVGSEFELYWNRSAKI